MTKNKIRSEIFAACYSTCVSLVWSCHWELLLQGEMVPPLPPNSPEAPAPGQLRLIQQPACKVNPPVPQSHHLLKQLHKIMKPFYYLSLYPAIKWGSHHCSPCPIIGNVPPSQTRHSFPAMCTSSGHCLHHSQRPAAGQEARYHVFSLSFFLRLLIYLFFVLVVSLPLSSIFEFLEI